MTTVRIDDVWKRYGSVDAVKAASFECASGEMLALLGPSGCGKTSMLKMIAGIEEVSQGEIYFDEKPISKLPPGARNIAMVFEDYALYPHMSAPENIAFPLKVRGYAKKEIRTRVERTIELLGLGEYRDESVQKLSGGAQQRIAIGRALVRDPDLLLFDEPLSHLDGDQKVQLRSEIKRLQMQSGLTSILVTHDQTEAIAMCDRVAVMKLGILQQCDTVDAVYNHPANLFVANFIGEPPMNLLSSEIQRHRDDIFLVGPAWRIPMTGALPDLLELNSGERVIVGVRPQHVEIKGANGSGGVGRIFFKEYRGDVDIILVQIEDQPHKVHHDGLLVQDILIAETDKMGAFSEGDAVSLRFDADRIHLFDGETGNNLRLSERHQSGGIEL